MTKASWIGSVLLHGAAGVSLFLAGRNLRTPLSDPTVLEPTACTIPIEVTAIAEQSQAPISRPKQPQAIVRKKPKEKPFAVAKKEPAQEPPMKDKEPPIKDVVTNQQEIVPEGSASQPDVTSEASLSQPPETIQPQSQDVKKKNETIETIPKEIVTKEIVKNEMVKKETKNKKTKEDKNKDKIKEKNTKKDKKTEIIETVLPQAKPNKKKAAAQKKIPKNRGAKTIDDLCDQANLKDDQPANLDETIENALVNLDENAEVGGEGETPITDKNSKSFYGAGKIGPLAMSAIDRVKQLLMQAWRVPQMAKECKDPLTVVVRMTMNPDATVRQASLVHDQSTTQHPAFEEAVQTALEAIEPYKTQPLPFPLEAYEQWKEFHFRFKRA